MLIGDDERVVSACHESSHVAFCEALFLKVTSVTIEGQPHFNMSLPSVIALAMSEYKIAVVFSAGKLGQAHFFPHGNHVDNVRDDRRLRWLCREKNRLKGEEFVRHELKNPRVIGEIERLMDRLLIDGTIEFK